jgi:hypothetical protein
MAALSPMMLDGSTQKRKRRKLVTSIKSLEKCVGRTEETSVSECTFQNFTPLYRFTVSHLCSTSCIALPLLRILSGQVRFDEQYIYYFFQITMITFLLLVLSISIPLLSEDITLRNGNECQKRHWGLSCNGTCQEGCEICNHLTGKCEDNTNNGTIIGSKLHLILHFMKGCWRCQYFKCNKYRVSNNYCLSWQ